MFSQQERQNAYILAVIDGIFLVYAFVFAFLTRVLVDLPGLPASPTLEFGVHAWLPALAVPMYWFIGSRGRLFRFRSSDGLLNSLGRVVKVTAYVILFLGTAVFLFQAKNVSRATFFLFLAYGFSSLAAIRVALWIASRRRPERFAARRNMLIVGSGPDAAEIRRKIEDRQDWGMRIVGHIETVPGDVGDPGAVPVLGDLSEFEAIAERDHVEEVVFAVPFESLLACQNQILWCEEVGITVHLRTDFVRTLFARLYATEIDGTPMLTVSPTPRDAVALLVKRVIDVVGSAASLFALSPVLIGTVLAIKLTSPGPIFFPQRRSGLHGRVFTMYKFRSMYRDAEARKHELATMNEVDGPVFKIRRDPRITPVGRWIRKFSIDELPQLWNVLRGDMSLVGPRPPLPKEVEQYERWQRRRLSMKPGITCLWQVSGRNHIGFEEWIRLDLAYIDNWSLTLDLKILVRTVPAVVLARGAN